MDKRKLALLKFFLNKCDGGYKVIELSKIYAVIKKYKSNYVLLSGDIEYLRQNKFIDVKYIDENNICLNVLDNSHILHSNLKSEYSVNRKHLFYMFLTMILSGVMAFAGAYLAIILTR